MELGLLVQDCGLLDHSSCFATNSALALLISLEGPARERGCRFYFSRSCGTLTLTVAVALSSELFVHVTVSV